MAEKTLLEKYDRKYNKHLSNDISDIKHRIDEIESDIKLADQMNVSTSEVYSWRFINDKRVRINVGAAIKDVC